MIAKDLLWTAERRAECRSDPRWLDAAARLARHPRLKASATAFLSKADPEAAKAAVKRTKKR
jgi:hypothetical protein